MNNHITFVQAKTMLNNTGMQYEILQLTNGWKSIITQYSGRLLGPFKNDEAESILWINSAMNDIESFRKFVENRELHLGGERLWINPELRFHCKAPELFNATYTVQDQLDPGHYKLFRESNAVSLEMTLTLDDLNNGCKKAMYIKRRYYIAENPLKYISSLKGIDVDYCGFMQDIELRDQSPEYKLEIEPWILTQVNPDDGKFVTPFMGEFEFVDYYTPIKDMQRVYDGYVETDVTGDRKYKVAYRAAQTFGRMAFVKPMVDGWHLMIRNYYNDPSVAYCSEPWDNQGNRGCSIFYYNDDLSNGGFAEFENSCITVGGNTGQSIANNTTSLWFFFGKQEEIGEIMKTLLGIDYKFKKYGVGRKLR